MRAPNEDEVDAYLKANSMPLPPLELSDTEKVRKLNEDLKVEIDNLRELLLKVGEPIANMLALMIETENWDEAEYIERNYLNDIQAALNLPLSNESNARPKNDD